MNKRKKQHYVPQFYLRKFAREDNKFTVINLKTKNIIEDAPCRDQCYENYYYGADEEWEKRLWEVETPTAEILKKIVEQTDYYPNLDEIKILKKYILYQRYRTTSNADDIFEIKWDTAKTQLEMELQTSVPDRLLQEVKKEFKNTYQEDIPQMALEITSEVLDLINDLDLLIVNYNNSKNQLISSDNPVIFYNVFFSHAVGLINAGLIIMLPISSNKMIILFDSKLYPRYKNKKIITLNNEKEVETLNLFQLVSAKEIVYFKNKNQASQVLSAIKDSNVLKERFKKSIHGQTFGTKNEKLLAVGQPYIPLKYEFSFCKLHSKAKNFGINESDWFPREKNEKYEQRMKIKVQAFKDINLLKGKMRRNNIKNMERFNKLVYDYWNDNL